MGYLKHPYNIRQLKEFKKKKTLRYRRDWVLLYLFKFIRVIIGAWIHCCHCYTVILKYRIRNKNI